MPLPLYKGFTEAVFQLLQSKWSSLLNPILSNTILQGTQLTGITLTASTPLAVYHTLGRLQQGWFITDINANTAIWRTQPFNASTITIESSADCVVDMWVY